MPLLCRPSFSSLSTSLASRLPLPHHCGYVSRLRLHPFVLRSLSSRAMSSPALVKGYWRAIPAKGELPKGRSSNASGVIGDVFYTFAGENRPRVPIDNDVFALDLKSHVWRRIPATSTSPSSRVGHACAVVDSKLFTYGGRTGAEFAETSLADLHSFDPSTSTWSPVPISPTSPHPPPLSYHSMTSSPTSLYLFGGCTVDHGRSNALWSFTPSTSTWALLSQDHPQGPPPCGGTTAVHLHRSIHVLFGYNGSEELDQHFAFDLNTQQWGRVETGEGVRPDARSVTDAVYLPKLDGVWVWGGEYTPSAQGHEGAGSYHGGKGWLFDVKEAQWRQAEDEGPSARGWFNSCAGPDGASVIVFGGFDGKERVNDTWVWTADVKGGEGGEE